MSENIKQQEIILNIIKKTDELCDKTSIDSERIAFFRDEIRKNVFFLQEELLEKHSETIIRYIIFPLIAYVDEKIMFKCNSSSDQFNWSLLQLEYYDKVDGGEYVFEIIDNLLSDTIYPKVCYEVIFFILEGGFQGKYFERTYDRTYVSYKKKVSKIIHDNKDYNELNISDATQARKKHKRKRKYISNTFKFLIPLALFGIGLLIFIY